MPRPRKTPRIIESYIPLPTAVKKYGVSKKLLTDLVNSGRIKAVKVEETLLIEERKVKMFSHPTQGLFATTDHPTLSKLRKKYASKAGQTIGILDAAKNYNVSDQTLYRWIEKGWITVVNGENYGLLLDESDIAIICELRRMGIIRSGSGSKNLAKWLKSPQLPEMA